jgi:hypothetical protein
VKRGKKDLFDISQVILNSFQAVGNEFIVDSPLDLEEVRKDELLDFPKLKLH